MLLNKHIPELFNKLIYIEPCKMDTVITKSYKKILSLT